MDINIGNQVVSIDNEEIKKALESEQGSLTIESDFVVRTKEQEDSFLKNIKNETIKAAMEMEVKKWRNDLGLEFEGKTVENLIKSLTDKHKSEFSKEPNEKLQDKDKDIQLLQSQIANLSQERDGLSNQFNEYKNTQTIANDLRANMPSNTLLPYDDMVMLLKNKLNPSVGENGQVVYTKDGDVLKDPTTLETYGTKHVITDFFANNPNYLQGVQGGAGGTDSKTSYPDNSIESFTEKYKSIGDVGTVEYNKALNEAIISGEVKV